MPINQLVPQKLSELIPGSPVALSLLMIEQPDGSVRSILFSQITGFAPSLTDFMLKSVYDPTDSGVVTNSANLNGNPASYYLDLTNATNLLDINKVAGLVTALADKVDVSSVGAAGGVCPLNLSGTIDPAYLPFSGLTYLGTWNATTNTPTISDGTGSLGEWYKCAVAGTQDLGSGNISFSVGDWVIHNGTVWEKNADASSVSSVNGQTGAVVLDTSDVDPTTDRRYVNDNVNDALAAAESAGLNSTNRRFALLNEVQASISVIPGILSPEAFGATHSTDTFADRGFNQAYIDANYPGIGAVTTDIIDWAAIQKCYYLAGSQNAVIMFSPYQYRVNKPITLPKFPSKIKTIGNLARIVTTNNNAFNIFGMQVPDNQDEAETIISNAVIFIDDLIIEGDVNQTGFYLNCATNVEMNNCYVYNTGSGIMCKFLLNAVFNKCFAWNNINGIGFLPSTWTGSTSSLASNHMTVLNNCQIKNGAGFTSGQTALEVAYSQSFTVNHIIIEGTTFVNGIKINNQFNNGFNIVLNDIYQECVSEISDSLIKIDNFGAMVEINRIFSVSSALLVNATSTGTGQVIVRDIRSAVPQGGKYFRNNNCWWLFENCWQFYNPAAPVSTYQSFFSGTIPNFAELIMNQTTRTIAPNYASGVNTFQIR